MVDEVAIKEQIENKSISPQVNDYYFDYGTHRWPAIGMNERINSSVAPMPVSTSA